MRFKKLVEVYYYFILGGVDVGIWDGFYYYRKYNFDNFIFICYFRI